MRRFIAIFFMMIVMTKLSAQSYHAVNFDAKTVAAMGAAYVVESETERRTRADIDSILGHYTKASLSTVGIYYSAMPCVMQVFSVQTRTITISASSSWLKMVLCQSSLLLLPKWLSNPTMPFIGVHTSIKLPIMLSSYASSLS